MPNNAAAISAKNLTKTLGGLMVLDDLSFDIAKGQTVALVGANGAGKTTLLNTISGVLQPAAGNVEFLGKRIENGLGRQSQRRKSK